jgi:hypothetical protein
MADDYGEAEDEEYAVEGAKMSFLALFAQRPRSEC